jgi:hypothetical protein
MRFATRTAIIFSCIAVILIMGCQGDPDAPRILDITFDPEGPVPTNSDVTVTADVTGGGLTYHWSVSGGIIRETQSHSPQAASDAEIMVTDAGDDDIGQVLDELGYEWTEEPLDTLGDEAALSDYDCVFVNSSLHLSVTNDEFALRRWVDDGGTLYASGRASELVDLLWPGKIVFPEPDPYVGSANPGSDFISAWVTDDGMAQSVGFISCEFAYPDRVWTPAVSTGSAVTTIMRADASGVVNAGSVTNLPVGYDFSDMPLAAFFSHGDGKVFFTNLYSDTSSGHSVDVLRRYFAAFVATEPMASTNHYLTDLAGFFPWKDYIGVMMEEDQTEYAFELDDADDVHLILNATRGVFTMTVDGPGDADREISGSVPFSTTFQDVESGDWTVAVEVTDASGAEYIPYVLSVAQRSQTEELITTVPEVIWRTPMEPETYTIKLRIIDSLSRADEWIVGLQVE